MGFYLNLIIVIVFAQLSVHCSTDPDSQETEYVQYIVKVDDIQHPSAVQLNDTLRIKFFGIIGNNGCHSFSHFESNLTGNTLDLTIWGKRAKAPICTAVMVYLDGKEFAVKAVQRGTFQIKIRQPDGTIISRSLTVN